MPDNADTLIAERIQSPLPHPEPASCRVRRARELCSETLTLLASLEGELSSSAGTSPDRRPDYWLGYLKGLMGWLLVVLEDEDAARR